MLAGVSKNWVYFEGCYLNPLEAVMPNLLIVGSPLVADELKCLRPTWTIAEALDGHLALELMHTRPVSFDLVLVRLSKVPKKLDGVMLVRLLSLHETLRTTRFAVLLEHPFDGRDNAAALAAGATRALAHPSNTDATFGLFLGAAVVV
jgi:CheY-like chemotaxis protein